MSFPALGIPPPFAVGPYDGVSCGLVWEQPSPGPPGWLWCAVVPPSPFLSERWLSCLSLLSVVWFIIQEPWEKVHRWRHWCAGGGRSPLARASRPGPGVCAGRCAGRWGRRGECGHCPMVFTSGGRGHSQTLQILEEGGSANSEAHKMRREARGGRRGSAIWQQFWKKQRCPGGQSRGLSCREGHFWQKNGICGGVGPSGGLTWDPQGLLWSARQVPVGQCGKAVGRHVC